MTDLHDTVVVHTCPEYNLTPEQCYASESCAICGIRRDEHADQAVQSAFPALDITSHKFRQFFSDQQRFAEGEARDGN